MSRARLPAFAFAIGIAMIVCASMLAPAAAPGPAPANDLIDIRRQLASDDFSKREAAQKRFDTLSLSHLPALRELAKNETDPEVKIRLDKGVNDLEIRRLTHLPGINLHVKDATVEEICAALSRQIGGNIQFLSADKGRYTLEADNVPLWDAILQLQRQDPFSIVATDTLSGAARNAIRLTRAPAPPPSHRLASFLVTPQIVGNPANDWSLRLFFIADPRIRITYYSSGLSIAGMTDQDRREIHFIAKASPTYVPEPVSSWINTISLPPAPGIKTIKELNATAELRILDVEDSLTVDLSKPSAPIETAHGTVTVTYDRAAEKLNVRWSLPATRQAVVDIQASIGMPYTAIRVVDQAGKTIAGTSTLSRNYTHPVRAADGPVKVELAWPRVVHTMCLPIILRDISIR